jgi:hypothetical protein
VVELSFKGGGGWTPDYVFCTTPTYFNKVTLLPFSSFSFFPAFFFLLLLFLPPFSHCYVKNTFNFHNPVVDSPQRKYKRKGEHKFGKVALTLTKKQIKANWNIVLI